MRNRSNMSDKYYHLPEMLPYCSHDRDSALRLAAQERWESMLGQGYRNLKSERRSAK